MNIKQFLNKTPTYQTKTFLLAGLMGLISSCKMDTNAPDDPKQQTSAQVTSFQDDVLNTPVDSFMLHMDNVNLARFYEPREDTHCFLFHADNFSGNVTGLTELRDIKDNDCSIQNPYNLTRTDNSCIDGSARFITDKYWVYNVEYSSEYGGGNWRIDCVTEAEYDTVYKNMTNQQLATLARNRILQKQPYGLNHADSIYYNILKGNGEWEQEKPFYVTFNSNGWKQNLKYSDFGTFDAATLDFSEGFTSMYSGGLKSNEFDKAQIPAQTFKATAFANVTNRSQDSDDSQLVVSTERDSASITIDAAQNETIVMPFNNWYKVTIIRTPYSVVSYLEDVNGNVAQTWQVPHQNTQETGYRSGTQDNGLFVTDGLYGDDQNGIVTGVSVNYYTDETGYIEFTGQGYRNDRANNQIMSFTFSIGGTNRPRPGEGGMTTGLENVYCMPKRQR